jgi:hypothetical protein
MRNILEESYLTRVEHARNVQVEVSQIPQYPMAPAQKYSLLSLIPRPSSNPVEKKESQLDETDLRFRRMRWVWFALAFGGVACYVVQPCMHTVIIGANRRPRRVQTHEAGQEDETVVSDEEGAKMKLFRTGTSKVSSCELCDTFRLHLCTILGHLKSICSFAVENEFLRGSCLES